MINNISKVFTLSIIMVCCIQCKKESEIKSGVDIDLANTRSQIISDLSYNLYFEIPELKDEDIASRVEIIFNLKNTRNNVLLDFKENEDHLISLKINGNDASPQIINEHIILSSTHLSKGENKVELEFTAGNLSLNRNDDYLYTLLVPARARTVFPVFDQPDLKASFTLTLNIPEDWEALSNGPVEKEDTLNSKKTIKYKKTKPISTYLFAFAAGKFNKMKDPSTSMTMYYRESDSAKVELNAPEIFRLHASSLTWLEAYTGIPYPFQKFDFALIPTFQYGGMEHPGSIFYRESALMLDPSASINQELRRASLIAHETAHMWFGDLVTMKWFDDVWLKEVFANFMAAKIVHPSFPEINHDLRFLLSHYPRAYEIDRSRGSHPIQQQLPNLADAGSVYGAIIYQKSPIVMRNLESIVGKDSFREGLGEYLNTYSFGNATWDDLIAIMNDKTEEDLGQWNRDWVKMAGMPIISFENTGDNKLKLKNQGEDNDRSWPQEIAVMISGDNRDTSLIYKTGQWQSGIDISGIGEFLFPNPDGRSYGYHQLGLSQLKVLQQIALNNSNALERAAAWIMIWESYLQEQDHRKDIAPFILSSIIQEPDPLILDYVSDVTRSIFWNFYSSDQRETAAANLEDVILERLASEKNMSIQRTLFYLYMSIATSPSSVENLRAMWDGTYQEMALPLSEQDQESLAYALALRLPEEGEAILRDQLSKLSNPDNKKRMTFVIPSLSSSREVRDSVFQSYTSAENRAVEPWVSQALSFLHHPLRQEFSISYLRQGLNLLEEVQQTGDIFFPKNWLDAILGGHNSGEAREEVLQFLNERKDLPGHLRNKVLQSSDILFRASHQG